MSSFAPDDDIQVVIFILNHEEFALPIKHVLEIVPVTNITEMPATEGSAIMGVINLRGQVIPVIDLARELALAQANGLEKTARIVVVEINQTRLGLLVDEVPEVLKIPTHTIEALPELIQISRKWVQGIGKIDNRLIVILDPATLTMPVEEPVQVPKET